MSDRIHGPPYPAAEVAGEEGEAAYRAVAFMYEHGWSDRLPLVSATPRRVAELLATTHRPPGQDIGRLDQLKSPVTVEVAAVHAVMAGCRPEHFPVVLAAWDALMGERSHVGGGWQSSSGPARVIVVNGPVRHRLGFTGPAQGLRPSTTVTRAIGLTVRNALGGVPHGLDRPAPGVLPGRWSMCVAENEEDSPWPPLSADGGVPAGTDAVSAILVDTSTFAGSSDTAAGPLMAELAGAIARIGGWTSRHAGAAVLLCPGHARLLARAGMSKDDVRALLTARCAPPSSPLPRRGDPGHLPIVVAGAADAGISMVARVFSGWSGTPVRVERNRDT
ncbi:hypothetical protein AB0K18_06895 [Nonomuraea sp. NPDC049421]|uniref:hypothetical protein n=1 Tax=Nonomuraea sp. NPDC049421 TaxID=3155275 RepID=UPI003446A841